ncbi:polysaccharide pyruvyl transferase family protein, partial [Sphaerobacter sp.]|uniref:polysaccharide pyruvyl transferase family protein n=1 Tax=Sphaerobacter sp. TaxID=2099654 RepID=UPI001DCDA4CC
MRYPIFVSFYAGDRYYHEAAKRLIDDCERLGIPHDIEELEVSAGFDWADICRMKARLFHRKLEEHKGAICWIDVDSRLLAKPPVFDGANFDFAAILRNYTYLKDYDPVMFGRTFCPSFLFFNYTDGGRRFAERIAELEARAENKATDDYFLEEAWRTSKDEMEILLLPPKRFSISGSFEDAPSHTWVWFGLSGNVRKFIDKVDQHSAGLFERQRQFRTLKSLMAAEVAEGNLLPATVYLRKMAELDPQQDDVIHKLGRVLRRQKLFDDALEAYEARLRLIEAEESHSQRHHEFLLGYFDFLLESGRLILAGKIADRLRAVPDPKIQAILRNRLFRLSLEKRARQLRAGTRRVPLWWMETPYPGNFGDVLNPYVIEKLTGAPPKLSAPGAGVLAIGSIIKFAKANTRVWGSGSPRLTDRLSAEATYCAVRGPATRRLVLDSGAECPEVFGDPALLLPILYQPRVQKRYALGLVRHHVHADEPLALSAEVQEIDILRCGYGEIERFIDEVCECEAIVSTSLHGLIVAQAYGIPAIWGTFSSSEKGIQGGDVKFIDYFASVGIHDPRP